MKYTEEKISTVYGPVNSWRVGKSLGVDLIMDPSTCSFNCTYCQLGFIQNITTERKIFISTDRVINDFLNSDWKDADVITFSGSGEPTLALNLGEVIGEIRKITDKKIVILTNGTLLNLDEVRKNVLLSDLISVKLDAFNEESLQAINRPNKNISFEIVLEGIKKIKNELLQLEKPKLQIQIMFMPQNKNEIKKLAEILNEIKPDEVALNTPTRPYPSGWDIVTRGAHGDDIKKIKFPTKNLKQLTFEEAKNIEDELKRLTNLKIISVYRE